MNNVRTRSYKDPSNDAMVAVVTVSLLQSFVSLEVAAAQQNEPYRERNKDGSEDRRPIPPICVPPLVRPTPDTWIRCSGTIASAPSWAGATPMFRPVHWAKELQAAELGP